jgi:hypothetical protein
MAHLCRHLTAELSHAGLRPLVNVSRAIRAASSRIGPQPS